MNFIKKLFNKLFRKNTDDASYREAKLYLLGNEAVCPVCSGAVKKTSYNTIWNCNDCHTLFFVINFEDCEPHTDREIKVKYFDRKRRVF